MQLSFMMQNEIWEVDAGTLETGTEVVTDLLLAKSFCTPSTFFFNIIIIFILSLMMVGAGEKSCDKSCIEHNCN